MTQDTASDTIEFLKKRIKKLSSQSLEHKMRLHDLAEELPIGWETIRDVAAETYESYRALAEARAELSGAGGGGG
ncbi:CCE_0567 family metalloprotein [Acidiferrobacter sp.]|uniref:CCE_0567 family metalloprotein n=1 Tax=Acidiferrobacter sp. TaxID=1872107 RepID=UPI002636A2A6|nr:CCE_0567 family metalloprotein [Acidiferrobacter sp.]